MENNIKIGLVIMASGLGKRFGGNKLMATLGDKPLIRWILDSSVGLYEKRVVVTRNKEVAKLCNDASIDCINHELPNRNDTVRLGLSYMINEVDYCFFVPGDQPLITTKSLEKLIIEAKNNKNKIVRASSGDIVGAPIGFPKEYFDELLKLPAGKGGNYIASHHESAVVKVKLQDANELRDIDTVEDLEQIKALLK